jgi:hypothetical protein
MLAAMAAIDRAAAGGVGQAAPTRDDASGPVVRNETARKVIIDGDGLELVLPPFAEAM